MTIRGVGGEPTQVFCRMKWKNFKPGLNMDVEKEKRTSCPFYNLGNCSSPLLLYFFNCTLIDVTEDLTQVTGMVLKHHCKERLETFSKREVR